MRRVLRIGIDEVGRGAWAGPLYFGAVCFIKRVRIPPSFFIRDSKALNRSQRERSAYFLRKNTLFCVSRVPKETIDKIGLQRSIKRGILGVMKKIKRQIARALELEEAQQQHVCKFLIDGKRMCELKDDHQFIIRGDSKVREISAASIVAKVARDRYMIRIAHRYPEYGFDRHVGYGTRDHQEALTRHGICSIHRQSYVPIRKIMSRTYAQRARNYYGIIVSEGRNPPLLKNKKTLERRKNIPAKNPQKIAAKIKKIHPYLDTKKSMVEAWVAKKND